MTRSVTPIVSWDVQSRMKHEQTKISLAIRECTDSTLEYDTQVAREYSVHSLALSHY